MILKAIASFAEINHLFFVLFLIIERKIKNSENKSSPYPYLLIRRRIKVKIYYSSVAGHLP